MNLISLILILCALMPLSVNAQNDDVKARLQAIANDFDALPKPERSKFTELKNKAFEAKSNEKYLTCLITIIDAQAIFDKDTDLLFLKGLCYAQIEDVDNAIEHYRRVLIINPTHMYTLMNMIEINYFAGRYKDSIRYIGKVHDALLKAKHEGDFTLLDFKHLIALTKLSKLYPEYEEQLEKVREKFTYMDDSPYYYYAKALASLDEGAKEEGLFSIYTAYYIFEERETIKEWNKALVDAGYIEAYEIMFSVPESE